MQKIEKTMKTKNLFIAFFLLVSVSLVHVNAQVCVQIAPEDAGEYSFGGLANKTIYYDSGLIDEYSGVDDYSNFWCFLLNRQVFYSPLTAGDYYGIMLVLKDSNDEYYYADFGNDMYFAYGTYYDEDLEEWI